MPAFQNTRILSWMMPIPARCWTDTKKDRKSRPEKTRLDFLRPAFSAWIRRESNPRPKARPAYFYDHILFLRITPFPASGEGTVNLAGLVASSYAHGRKA